MNRNTVNRYLRGLRERMAAFCEAQAPFAREVEVEGNESYFGGHRVYSHLLLRIARSILSKVSGNHSLRCLAM